MVQVRIFQRMLWKNMLERIPRLLDFFSDNISINSSEKFRKILWRIFQRNVLRIFRWILWNVFRKILQVLRCVNLMDNPSTNPSILIRVILRTPRLTVLKILGIQLQPHLPASYNNHPGMNNNRQISVTVWQVFQRPRPPSIRVWIPATNKDRLWLLCSFRKYKVSFRLDWLGGCGSRQLLMRKGPVASV